MSAEPDLHPGMRDEWVAYLKQLMQHWGYWQGDLDENFTDELGAAVQAVQQGCGVLPADGVVRDDTWAILTGEAAVSAEQARRQAG